MPTQEDRLSLLEQSYKNVSESIKDLNHYVTMVVGIVGKQEIDIREIRISKHSTDDRLGVIEQRVTSLQENVVGLHDKFDRLEKLLLDRLPPA